MYDNIYTNQLRLKVKISKAIMEGYRNNARRRKIAEASLVKKLKPTLNIQEKLVPLKLFN